MLDGRCPKCGSTDVRRRYQGLGFVDRPGSYGGPRVVTGPQPQTAGPFGAANIGVSPDGWAYVCVSCGYWEHYVADKELLLKVAQDWERVPVSPGASVGSGTDEGTL